MVDTGENGVLAGGQRLLDQRYLQFRRKSQIIFDIIIVPALIGVDDDARLRCCGAHGAQACLVIGGSGLDLQQRAACVFRRFRGHGLGVGE
ncbi:hypothetical protein D3C78_1157760 [compost metagenome]